MTCTFPECDRKKYAADLCRGHYAQRARGQALRPLTRRGFAGLDAAQRSAIASRGGRAAQEKGTAHRWTQKAARRAGAKGGLIRMGRLHGWTEERIATALQERGL